MSNLNKQTITELTRLCRIDCTPDEQDTLLQDLGKILDYIEQLKEINTDDVPACYQVLESTENVFREDDIGQILDRTVFLANAPSHIGGMIRVPTVIKQT